MCVLRTNRTDTYSAIKKYTFCDRGIASQVFTFLISIFKSKIYINIYLLSGNYRSNYRRNRRQINVGGYQSHDTNCLQVGC
jgi:hypothetical protein